MSVTKDGDTGRWMSQIRVTDWTGQTIHKPSAVASKKWLIDLKVTPFFKKIPLNEIKPTHVRQWQNSLTSYRDENGKPYAQTYLKCINNQLTAIFNYAGTLWIW